MRNLMLACVGLTLMSGVVSVSLWRELRAERALSVASGRRRLSCHARRQKRDSEALRGAVFAVLCMGFSGRTT